MKQIREFAPSDRYRYDFKYCSHHEGWAQVDSQQDASYFGTWANPERLEIFNYCEGDTCLTVADTPEEFAQELRSIDKWNQEMGFKPVKIDGMCSESIIAAFKAIGLADMLH